LIAPYIQGRNGMRQLFPCWDQPQLKATFNISIKHPRSCSALSNMPIKSIISDSHKDSLRTYFYITPPMTIFQIAIVLTEYQRFRVNENITLWCDCDSKGWREKFEFARKIINNITLQLKSEFGGINIPKMDHIAIPNCPQDGISKWGLIFHSESNLIYDETLDPVIRKMEVARLIAPKIAYQWFSNLLSSDWSYLWLHDALATMFGEEAVVKSFNNSEILDLFIIQNQYESLHLDSHFNMNPVEITYLSDISSIFSFPRYMKAIIVLRMFQIAITDEVFRNNVHVYVSRQTFSSIIPYNFWSTKEELDEAYNCNLPSNEFLTWIQYKHYPVVIWEQYEHSRVIKRISKSYNTTSYGKWLIPITLREISSLNENMWKICLKPNIGSSEFPTAILNKSWMVNIEQAGYYRIKYDSITWGNIAKYLNDTAGDYKSISVINRAKFIDDAFHLMMNRELDVSAFWNLTKFLSQETNFVVWYPMIKGFEYMSNLIPLSREEIEFADIMEKLKKLLEKPLKTLGYEEHLVENDFVKYLRQEIVKWACIFQFDECKQSAFRKLMQHLGNPEINPLLIAPYIQERNGMRQLFPCWDQPQLRATFNISIKHPRYYSALSNMPTKFMTYDNYTDSLRTYFYITPQMSTFQIGIVMTEYQSIKINKNITLWCDCDSEERRPKFEFARRIMNNITLQLKSEFGGIIIPKMDHIAIPNFPQDSISKLGLIFHSEANLIYDETLDTVIRKMEVARLIAPKISYQWFSNLLSSDWSHLWLHDALATMFGEEAVVKSFNNSEILDLFIIQNQYESLHLDSHFNMNPVETTRSSDINSIFSFPRYMKAIIVLRMFRSAITDEVFRNNVHAYISRQTFSSIISYNFWSTKEELDEAYNCNLPSNEFLTWIQYKHYPVVIWEQYEHSRVIKRNIEKLKKLLEKPLKTLGYEEHLVENDFVKCLRQEIVKWACIFQFDECEQSAFRKLMQHLGNPEINPLLPWWKHWTYCNGVAVTYLFTWTLIRDTWFKARNHKLLPFLTCFRNATPNTTSSLLSERFQEEGQQDITNIRSYINIFHSVIAKYCNTHDILEMIFRKLEIMKPA
ncbi:Glutamyl aminopeptidase, partial [Trachymyrmex cornetzi]